MKHWRENYLVKLEDQDRNYFCFWAHKRVGVRIFSPDQQKLNLSAGIFGYVADLYEIFKSTKSEHVAIRCRTEPRMYLRLGNLQVDNAHDGSQPDKDNVNKIIIAMFVEPKVETS